MSVWHNNCLRLFKFQIKAYRPDWAGLGRWIFCVFALRDGECVRKLAHLLAGVVAQLVEHHNGIVGVRGSNPLGSTSLNVWSSITYTHILMQRTIVAGGWFFLSEKEGEQIA
jgi:hypothetical protein